MKSPPLAKPLGFGELPIEGPPRGPIPNQKSYAVIAALALVAPHAAATTTTPLWHRARNRRHRPLTRHPCAPDETRRLGRSDDPAAHRPTASSRSGNLTRGV